MNGKDYYAILGVDKNASKDEIKKAFRKRAHEFHPDKSGGDEKKFKEINEAYGVLSDDRKRQQYDTFGSAGPGGGFGGAEGGWDFSGFSAGQQGFDFSNFDFSDVFGDIFAGGRQSRASRGADISVDIELTFEEAVFGVEKIISLTKSGACDHCDGSGAERNSGFVTCNKCNGKGQITEIRKSFIGSFQTNRICDVCFGKGKVPEKKCSVCRGSGIERKRHDIKVKIPSGLDNGEMIRLSNAGESVVGGNPGDLYIKIHVKKHSHFHKEGQNLVMNLPIKLSDALLGSEYKIQTLDGEIVIKVPEGTKFGDVLRVRGKGIPSSRGARGDILIQLDIQMPRKLSRNARRILDDLKSEGL